MLSYLVFGFLFVVQTIITDTDGEALKAPLKSKEDIFRVLLNQETLIRSALEKKVIGLVDDMVNMKENMVYNKKEIVYLKIENQELKGKTNKHLQNAKKEIAALKKKNQDAKKESVALKNEIRALKANFQDQANETKLLSGMFYYRHVNVMKQSDQSFQFRKQSLDFICYLSMSFKTPQKLMLKSPRKRR